MDSRNKCFCGTRPGAGDLTGDRKALPPRGRRCRSNTQLPQSHGWLAQTDDGNSPSCAIRPSASASADGSSGGTRSAFNSGRAISRHPGTPVATRPRPHAAASKRLTGRPSRCEGRTAKCADFQTLEISETCPNTPGGCLLCDQFQASAGFYRGVAPSRNAIGSGYLLCW